MTFAYTNKVTHTHSPPGELLIFFVLKNAHVNPIQVD